MAFAAQFALVQPDTSLRAISVANQSTPDEPVPNGPVRDKSISDRLDDCFVGNYFQLPTISNRQLFSTTNDLRFASTPTLMPRLSRMPVYDQFPFIYSENKTGVSGKIFLQNGTSSSSWREKLFSCWFALLLSSEPP